MQILNFMKIRPVGAELFFADGQTDITKLKSLFIILATHLAIILHRGIFYTNRSLGSNVEREAEISLTSLTNITKITARTADGTTRFLLGTSRKQVIHY
jgi:hypothetical protein